MEGGAADATSGSRADVAAARAGLEREREAIVASARRLSMLGGRASRGGPPAGDEARAMLDELLELRIARAEVQQRYALRLYERLPAWKVARFFEIETRMDAAVDYHLSRSIPLLD